MTPLFKDKEILIASGNKGKIEEIAHLLEPYGVKVRSALEFDLEEPEETGQSFMDNALLKAKYYCEKTHLPALADDSGLCVDGLHGAPGVYSARWAGETKDFYVAMSRIESELSNNPNRQAHFMCALALYYPNGHTTLVEGRVDGHLTFPPRGTHGFGYDPIFVPEGYDQTFGELPPQIKHDISHRSKAFSLLIQTLFHDS